MNNLQKAFSANFIIDDASQCKNVYEILKECYVNGTFSI
jgi:hypothetical protein